MSSFDDWFENYEDKFEINAKILCSDAFKAGAQSRQAEIDKLEKDNEGYRKLVNYDTQEMEKLHNKIDELKKRIDGAIYGLQNIESAMWEEQIEDVLCILKGNQS